MKKTDKERIDVQLVQARRRQLSQARTARIEARIAKIMRPRIPGIIERVKHDFDRGQQLAAVHTPRWVRFQDASTVKRVVDSLLAEAGQPEIRFMLMRLSRKSVFGFQPNSTQIVFATTED